MAMLGYGNHTINVSYNFIWITELQNLNESASQSNTQLTSLNKQNKVSPTLPLTFPIPVNRASCTRVS